MVCGPASASRNSTWVRPPRSTTATAIWASCRRHALSAFQAISFASSSESCFTSTKSRDLSCARAPVDSAITTAIMPRAVGSLGTEELDERLLDLFVALLQLLRVHLEETEVRELGPVGRILHVGMAGVEALRIGEHLLQLTAEEEVREELRGVRVGREAGDRARGDDQRNAFLRVHDLDRIPLLLVLVKRVVAAIHGNRPLAGSDHTRWVDRRLHEHELVLRELLPVVPAVQMHEGQHVGGDDSAIPRMGGHFLALPLRVQQVLPRLGRLVGGNALGLVGDDGHGGAERVVVPVLVHEGRRKTVDTGGRVLHEALLLLQQDEVTSVGSVDHVRVLDVGRELLHHALDDALGSGALHLNLDTRIRLLEELCDLLRAGQCQRRVPDDLAFLLGRLDPSVLRSGRRRDEQEEEGHEAPDANDPGHRNLLHVARVWASSVIDVAVGSSPTTRIKRDAWSRETARVALPRNFASRSARIIGKSGPPRGWSCRSSMTRPSRNVIATWPTNCRG